MKIKHLSLFTGLALLASNTIAAPLGTAFTYQGKLVDGTNAANGVYDLQMRIFDDAAAGAQQGPTLLHNDIVVSNGLFVVDLDFGAGVFTGNALWLDIGVRPGASGGGYTLLTPRQPITPAPYAIYAATAPVEDNAVTSVKIANGAITGADVADNTIGSAQLADGIDLGTSGIDGLLNLYRTGAGTPGITLNGGTSRISTFGEDGLEQIRLWGVGFGEILLNNSLADNRTAVVLSANGASGGRLQLFNTNNSVRAELNGANAGGSLTLRQADGQIGAFLDGDNSGSGLLSLYNTNGSTRISLYGQSPTSSSGGEVSVLSSNGTETVEILGQTDALTGGKITLKRDDGVVGTTLVAEDGNGEGATFQLYQSAGGLGLRLEGDYFNGGRAMFYNSRSNVTVDIQGDGDTGRAGYLKLNTTNGANRVTLIGNGSGGGGEMRLANTNALNRLSFYGQGANGAGEINVFDTSGTETIEILGQQSSTLGSRITLRQSSGISSLTLDGEYGSAGEGSAIMLNNGAGSQRLRIEGDASDAGYLVVYGTNGAPNITLDGFSPSGNGRVTTEELQITSATTTIATGATLTPATGYVRISGSGGPVTLSAITAIASGSGAGLMLVLEGTSDLNTVTVPDNANTRLPAARTLGLNDTLTLIWNGTDWVEISFSNN